MFNKMDPEWLRVGHAQGHEPNSLTNYKASSWPKFQALA